MVWIPLVALNGCADRPPATASSPTNPPTVTELAQQVVADRLGLDPSLVTIMESTAVDFPDSSLGCPQPGMAYAQVITPGYRIRAEAEDAFFDVRVSGSRAIICENAPKRQTSRRAY